MDKDKYTHEHATSGLRHVSEYIPENLKEAARIANQLPRLSGQSHFEATKAICRLLKMGFS